MLLPQVPLYLSHHHKCAQVSVPLGSCFNKRQKRYFARKGLVGGGGVSGGVSSIAVARIHFPAANQRRDETMASVGNTGAEGNSPLTTSYRRRIFAGRNDFCLHAYVKWKCDGRICLGLEHYKPVLHREL